MGLKGKLVVQTEIKSDGDLYHEMFKYKPHLMPSVCPDKIHSVVLHAGHWGTVGSVTNWNYTIEGQEKVLEVVIDTIDEKKKLVSLKAFEGNMMEQYKAFKATVHIETHGQDSLVTWTIEYEKQNEDVPEPLSYVDFALKLTKDIGAHHVE